MRAKVFEMAPAILDHLSTLTSENETLINDSATLVSAINQAKYTDPVFSHPQLAALILLAYKHNDITIEQMSSAMLIWEAKADFPEMQNVEIHRISDKSSQRLFCSYLKVFDALVKKEILDVSFLNDSLPFSEQHFVSFDIPVKTLPTIYNTLINGIGFRFFMPNICDDIATFIVPSYTLLQRALDKIDGERILLTPRFGDDTFDTLDTLHRERMHPLALSFPLNDFEKLEADLNSSLRLGFTLHDIFHVVLLKGNDNLPHIHSLIAATKALQVKKNDDYDKTFSKIVDGELTALQLMYNANPLVRSFEVYLFVVIQQHVNSCLQIETLNEMITNEALKACYKTISISNPVRIKQVWVNILLQALAHEDFKLHLSLYTMLNVLYGSLGIVQNLSQTNNLTTDIAKHSNQITIDIIETVLFDAPTNTPELLQLRQWLQDIYDAVALNNKDKLRELVKPDSSVEFGALGKYGKSLLRLAVEHQYADMVAFICENYGLDVREQSDLLFIACHNKDANTIEVLLQNHANPFVRDEKYKKPYEISFQLYDEDAIRVFLRYQHIPYAHVYRLKVIDSFKDFTQKLERFDGTDDSLQRLIDANVDGFSLGAAILNLKPTQMIRLMTKRALLYHLDENTQVWHKFLDLILKNPDVSQAFSTHPDMQYVFKHFLVEKIYLNDSLLNLFSAYVIDYFKCQSHQHLIATQLIQALATDQAPPITTLVKYGLNMNQRFVIIMRELFSPKTALLSLWQALRGLKVPVYKSCPESFFPTLSHKVLNISIFERKIMLATLNVDPNQPSANGGLEIINALKNGDEAYVRLLIDRGASVDYRNANNETARMIATDEQLEWLGLGSVRDCSCNTP